MDITKEINGQERAPHQKWMHLLAESLGEVFHKNTRNKKAAFMCSRVELETTTNKAIDTAVRLMHGRFARTVDEIIVEMTDAKRTIADAIMEQNRTPWHKFAVKKEWKAKENEAVSYLSGLEAAMKIICSLEPLDVKPKTKKKDAAA